MLAMDELELPSLALLCEQKHAAFAAAHAVHVRGGVSAATPKFLQPTAAHQMLTGHLRLHTDGGS